MIDQSEVPIQSATIDLAVLPGGRATGSDYAGVPERVTITAPSTEATFVIAAVEDNHFDDGETVVLGFGQPLPSGVTTSLPDTVAVTIQDPGTVATTDREVLEALYHATGGPNWTNSTNWLSAAPLGQWFGIVTDGNNRVTQLSLRDNGLSGPIPPSLSQLSNLQSLHLAFNVNLTGMAPSGLR